MALSDYMPYGAPELLDTAQSRMARSTLLASLTVAVFVAAMGAWTARNITPAPGIAEEEKRVYDLFEWLVPPPPALAPSEVPPAPPMKTLAEDGELVPRPDEIAPPEIAPPAGPLVRGDEHGSTIDPGQAGAVTGTGGFASDPRPGEFVWTDEMPVLVKSRTAVYPDLARQAGVEGTVTVQMLIGLDGRVEKALIAPRGSVPLLDEAALEAARSSVFTPALANNRPVKVWVSQQYRFSLH